MPLITCRENFDGFEAKTQRLALTPLVSEVEAILTRFRLLVETRTHANGTKWLRQEIDRGFEAAGGWTKLVSGGVDWTKQSPIGATMAVEVQVSGRSDMLAVDVLHLADGIRKGNIDVGIIVVPDDKLSRFLTDRTPNYRTAMRHMEKVKDQPIQIIAFGHDGVGPALDKIRTNLGKS